MYKTAFHSAQFKGTIAKSIYIYQKVFLILLILLKIYEILLLLMGRSLPKRMERKVS